MKASILKSLKPTTYQPAKPDRHVVGVLDFFIDLFLVTDRSNEREPDCPQSCHDNC